VRREKREGKESDKAESFDLNCTRTLPKYRAYVHVLLILIIYTFFKYI